jgi:hypothetical protein
MAVAGFVPRRFVVAMFHDGESMLAAAARVRMRDLGRVDTHSPYPVRGIEAALGIGRPRIPLLVLLGGLLGAIAGYTMILYVNAIDWPFNVGNRPPHSPPAHIPVTFELGILFGAGFAFFGLLILIGLPRPYHPLFQAPSFGRASIDRFFVSVELPRAGVPDPVLEELRAAGASGVEVVEEWER